MGEQKNYAGDGKNLKVSAFDVKQQPAVLVSQHRPQDKRNPNDQGFSPQQHQRAQRVINFEQPDHVGSLP